MDVGRPTFDQLAIFLAVVDEGSFNAAAKRMGRAISAISYGIAGLEAQLGVTLFEREGSRRPVLTADGKAILAHAREVTDEVEALVAGVRGRNQGLEASLGLAVDVMCPSAVIADILRDFRQAFPTVELHLYVEALGSIAALVLNGQAQLGVGGPMTVDDPALERQVVGAVDLIPVAAPTQALARMDPIPPGTARQYLQLVLTDRSLLTQGREFSVLSPRSWRLGDLGAKHALLLEGIGWGNMPLHVVAADLAAGRLVRLPVPEAPGVSYDLNALWRKDCPPAPAQSWMLAALKERLGPARPGTAAA